MNIHPSNPVEIFKALGDQNRLKIIKLILLKGNKLCVGMLSQKLGITQPSVSQHLKILKTAGLIEGEKSGFHVHYKVQKASFESSGIDITSILDRVDIDVKPAENCEHRGIEQECDKINK